jgi:hypothetical protein
LISLPVRSDRYTVGFPYENGYYSARLSAFGSDVHAGTTLLAPQASLDHSAPIVDLDDAIKIPVYQSHSLIFSDFITDVSPYTVKIDDDITKDTNNDGIYDNDFGTIQSGAVIGEQSMRF